MKKYVNVCLNDCVLATVIAQEKPGLMIISKNYNGLTFPDSDRLYLEDIDGFRYKRIDFLNNNLIFERI